jgi:hypothetical protein
MTRSELREAPLEKSEMRRRKDLRSVIWTLDRLVRRSNCRKRDGILCSLTLGVLPLPHGRYGYTQDRARAICGW